MTDPNEGRKSRVNPMIWFEIFKARSQMECLIEIIKNGFDWGATVLNFDTKEHYDCFRHIDDGCGMNAENRWAFLSVGYSTADSDVQAGKFGTGAKKFIFTFSSRVKVVTVSEDEPDLVYTAEFTPYDLAAEYSGETTIEWRVARKNRVNWPHEHPTGTDVTYTLKEPNSRAITRGKRLAQTLSDRLNIIFIEHGMVRVDGEYLPSKHIVGRLFESEETIPGLGRVKLEFYRPERRSATEDLRMTGRSVGEVSFRDTFVKMLPEDLREQVPALFLEGEVCGLITAEFLDSHVTESRTYYNSTTIAGDERVVELLRLLRLAEADVATHLGIKLRHPDASEVDGQEELDELAARLNRIFNPSGLVPPQLANGDDDGTSGGIKNPGRSRSGKPSPTGVVAKLTCDRPEYEPGDIITVRLTVPPNMDPKGFQYYYSQSHAKLESTEDGVVKLRATDVGRGLIQASNARVNMNLEVEYEVVLERVFHLSVQGPIGLALGSQLVISAVNADKLAGAPVWSLREGDGTLAVAARNQSARFTATRNGRVVVKVHDSLKPSTQDSCRIAVTSPSADRKFFYIRGEAFATETTESNLEKYAKPVTITPAGPGGLHRLSYNSASPGYVTARKAGCLPAVVAYALALEFTKHFTVALDWDDVDPLEAPTLQLRWQKEADILYKQMTEAS